MKTIEGYDSFKGRNPLDKHRLDEATRFGYGLVRSSIAICETLTGGCLSQQRTKLGDSFFLENVTAMSKNYFETLQLPR